MLSDQTITIQGHKISFSECGSGKPILMLHGNPGTRFDFRQISENLFDKGCYCISPDRPGHANSDPLPTSSDPWLDSDIFGEIITQKCSGKAYVAGYSLGAFTALKIALRHPRKVSGLCLMAPFILPANPQEPVSSLPQIAERPFLGFILSILLPKLAQSRIRKHLTATYDPCEIPPRVLDENAAQFTGFSTLIATIRDKNSMLQMLNQVQAKLAAISCPVLVIGGEADKICDMKAQIEIIRKNIADHSVLELPQAGHALPFTHHQEICDTMLNHINQS